MRYWIIRTNTSRIEVSRDRQELTFLFRRRVSIKPNDVLVLLEEEQKFTSWAWVKHVEKDEKFQTEGEQIVTKVWVEPWEELPDGVDYSIFANSLTFVWNRAHLKRHLRPAYRRLPEEDFKTLQAGEPFFAREAYFILLDALPESLQAQFRAERILARSEVKQVSTQLSRSHRQKDEALALLQFVEERVLGSGRIIIESDMLWRQLTERSASNEVYEAYFSDDEEGARADNLAEQARLFRGLFESLNEDSRSETNLLTRVSQELNSEEQIETDRRLEAVFEKANK